MTYKPPFEQIVETHADTVLRVCRARLDSWADAEDAWSDTFLAAMRAYPDLPADANVQAWLVTIAHRKSIDVVRAAARRGIPVENVPEATPIGQDDAAEVWQAVAALPNKQRLVVAYHYFGGLPYKEVADIVGGTAAAARRAAADGLSSLRVALTEPAIVDQEGVAR
ncbi:MAG: sigma-70 family RNA polymerase sigma factor [Rhodococcus sp.]|nr:sigma-70 family RNA polymerase sigma factor [Rhodococcus sp. (in: high G+C Gram-positive bacteria)]